MHLAFTKVSFNFIRILFSYTQRVSFSPITSKQSLTPNSHKVSDKIRPCHKTHRTSYNTPDCELGCRRGGWRRSAGVNNISGYYHRRIKTTNITVRSKYITPVIFILQSLMNLPRTYAFGNLYVYSFIHCITVEHQKLICPK